LICAHNLTLIFQKYIKISGICAHNVIVIGFIIWPTSPKSIGGNGVFMARPNYNGTLTFLCLGIYGNIRLYTYYDKVDWGAWEVTYSLLDRDWSESQRECQLPEHCGEFGLCEDNQCVACPLSNGLLSLSKDTTSSTSKLLVA
jgi:hypothetical protein